MENNEKQNLADWTEFLAKEYPEASQEELEVMLVDFDSGSDLQVVRFKDEHGSDLFVHTLVTMDPELNKAMDEFGFDFEDDYCSDDSQEAIEAGLERLKGYKVLLQNPDNRERLIDLANRHEVIVKIAGEVKDRIDQLFENFEEAREKKLVQRLGRQGEALNDVEEDIQVQLQELLTGEYRQSN